MGGVFPLVVVSLLPHVEFGRNDHREDAPLFNITEIVSNKSLCEMISNDYSWSMNHGVLSIHENQRMVSDGILFSWINIQVAFLLRMTHIL